MLQRSMRTAWFGLRSPSDSALCPMLVSRVGRALNRYAITPLDYRLGGFHDYANEQDSFDFICCICNNVRVERFPG